MKKLLLSAFLAASFAMNAQTSVYSFGFDGTTATMEAAGWMRTNQGSPATTALWNIASYAPVVVSGTQGPLPFTDVITPSGSVSNPPNGHQGGPNSFAVVNFNSTGVTNPITGAITGSGTISNWLISPAITVQNGDVVSFYTRIGKNSATAASYADNLQLRMSTNGATTVNPTGGSTGLGDFTTLLAEVNPNLNLSSYPMSWATGLITATISGLSGPTAVKFAFRYFVPSGGPGGANSDIIGIDTFSVNRTLGTSDFFKANFAVFPNPASNLLNITAHNGVSITKAIITDINGRVVSQQNLDGVSETGINVANLARGAYFISVESAGGKGTAKFLKN